MPGPQLLPPQYADLRNLAGPRLIVVALQDYGLQEYPGGADNPVIMQWARELGLPQYVHDSIAWCGLGVGHWCQRASKPVIPNPLWALNWSGWQQPAEGGPMLGDILTFKRDGGGHVALYVGEDEACFHILGCNQSDSVNITRIAKNRLYSARRPVWQTQQPAEVRRIFRSPTGGISQNEA